MVRIGIARLKDCLREFRSRKRLQSFTTTTTGGEMLNLMKPYQNKKKRKTNKPCSAFPSLCAESWSVEVAN